MLRREARENLRLALPIVATQVSFMSMGTVDTIMAGRLGADELAAIGIGSNIWFLFFVIFIGVFMACSPIVAQRVGAGASPVETGGFVRSAAILAMGCGVLWMLVVRVLAQPILSLLDLSERANVFASDYLDALSWGAIPLCLCFLGRNVAEGHAITRVALAAGVVAFAINAALDYGLMYGAWGLPALGPAGCGWASSAASIAMLLIYALAYARLRRLRALQVFRSGIPVQVSRDVGEILRLGLPIALIVAAESWLFNLGALIIARFGGDVVGAHQIAINFAALSFMVPMSIGLATTVRVGHAAGAGLQHEVRARGLAGVALGVTFAAMSASAMALAPGLIVAAYTDTPDVAAMAVRFLYFAAIFQLFDCVQATASGALRGIKETRVPMLITVAAYWVVGLPLAAGLAFQTAAGPFGVWLGFIAALALAAVGLLTRFVLRTRQWQVGAAPAG
ncbi:MATE family efflux transporter [Sinimarinibacterium sp. CAU 1509]|nr:MATE family efflux transporter [Sinimarinibacterium sp. CAU 1509]